MTLSRLPALAVLLLSLLAQWQMRSATPRPGPPARNPQTPGFVSARELADGTVPPADKDGNFILSPMHPPAPATLPHPDVHHGVVSEFMLSSTDSKFYLGIARDPTTFGTPDANNPAKLVVTTSHLAPYTRRVTVYVPKQYDAGTAAPFIIGADGPDPLLFTTLDNLIAAGRVPAMIAIPSPTVVVTRRVANAVWNTTPCQAAMQNSWRGKCSRQLSRACT